MAFGRDGFFNSGDLHEVTVTCSECGKSFKRDFVPRAGTSVYCPECMASKNRFTDAEIELLKQELNLEESDLSISQKIRTTLFEIKNGKLPKNQFLLSELLKQLVADNERRASILKQFQSLEAQEPK